MAYSATATLTRELHDGHWCTRVALVETGARDTSEATISGVPTMGTIVEWRATLTAGTGTAINPAIGTTAAFVASTQAHVGTSSIVAAHVHDQTPLRYDAPAGVIYVRSTPNSAVADHAISTVILIADGVEV